MRGDAVQRQVGQRKKQGRRVVKENREYDEKEMRKGKEEENNEKEEDASSRCLGY